ncbi:hypothetical protein PSTT_08070 [Puccinia striiformis]|uniref:Uncharacterized protein n=1 Tax=Puccinia striiformis TaxID=27350 RepID=A0A2S4VDS3_9BASI|nr:hypothetical protein PSTT_08070 [Puccinia striiformis]
MATSSNDPPREAPSSSPQSGRFGFMISIVGDEPHESKVGMTAPVDTLRRFKAEKASDGGQALDSTTRRPSTYAVTERARSQGPRDSSRSFVPLQEKDESIVQDPTYPNRLDKGLVKASGSYWDTIFSNIDKSKSAGRGALSEEEQPTPSSLPEKLISKLWSKIADNLKQLIAPEEGISQKNTLTPADDLKGKLESGNEPGVEAPISSQETNVPVEASTSTGHLHQILKGPNLGPSILLKSTSGSLGHKPTLSEDAKRARKHWRSAANKVHAVQSLKGVDKTIHQVDNYLQKIDGVLDVLDFTFKNIKEVNQKVEDYGLSVWLNKGNPFG